MAHVPAPSQVATSSASQTSSPSSAIDEARVQSAINAFAAGADAPKRWIAGLSREQLLAHPVPKTWSMQTLIVHMLESDLAAVHRMRRVAAEDMPLLIAYDETRAAAHLAYDKADAAQVCELFSLLRAFATSWLRTLPPSAFTRCGVHNQRGRVSLTDLVDIYVHHVNHHEKFAFEKRKALGMPTT